MSKDHVIMRPNGFGCLHCGTEYIMTMPAPIGVFAAAAKAFGDGHKRCKKSDAGRARMKYSDVDRWYQSWDTGLSSKTIYCVLRGIHNSNRINPTPQDPSDFGRCIRLMEVAPPDWRNRLMEVSEKFPHWKPIIENWDELVSLYNEESPSRTCPRLYERMKVLNGRV